MKIIFCVLSSVLTFILLSCSKGDIPTSLKETDKDINVELDSMEFFINAQDGHRYEAFQISDSTIHVNVNDDTNLTSVTFSFPQNVEASIGNEIVVPEATPFDLSDFCTPPSIMLSNTFGDISTKKLVVHNLPVIRINTPDGTPILSREERTNDCMVDMIVGGIKIDLGDADIKSRGGSTWYLDKKPYNLKFHQKVELLGMPKSKHWILLANSYYDRTQLHNDVAFEMARMTNNPWVQSGTFVELILNGEHKGLYYLCEKIGVEKNKINFEKIKESDIDGEELTGGYLLEMSEYPGVEPYSFATAFFNKTGSQLRMNYGWKLKEPEDNVPEAQFNYIQQAMNYMESLIWNDDSLKSGKYRDYLDIETCINWWLVEEATLNEEASRSKNVYLYKERGDNHFRYGPPWDFDAWAFGAHPNGICRFYCINTALYYRQLFKDSVFVNRIKEKWNEIYPIWRTRIPEYIDRRFRQIENSALRNETLLWTNWHEVYQYPQKTYRQCVDDMKSNLINQLDWMDGQISNM